MVRNFVQKKWVIGERALLPENIFKIFKQKIVFGIDLASPSFLKISDKATFNFCLNRLHTVRVLQILIFAKFTELASMQIIAFASLQSLKVLAKATTFFVY